MTNIIQKPMFEEVIGVTTMNLPDFGLQFNANPVGPTSFPGLRSSNYGPDFRMSTMPEIIPLIYSSLKNQDKPAAKKVIHSLIERWITGNTATLYTSEGIFVKDNPEINHGVIVMNEKALETMLGSHEENSVVFSDDRSLRFTPYGFKRKHQTTSELAGNSGVLALVGSRENAEMLTEISKNYPQDPCLWTLDNRAESQIKVVALNTYDFVDRLALISGNSVRDHVRCSYGVRELKKGFFSSLYESLRKRWQ